MQPIISTAISTSCAAPGHACCATEERRDGATAIVMRETETTGSYKDAEVHVFGLETAVLEKLGDGWQIVHLHWSSRKATAK
ncbi:hypothetical protein [Massilia eburnea]|uniref:hypothetical protein n=1 Tax=Massilia eburnea TaxID=1776165 RepID=UPI003D6C3E0D